MSLNTPPARTTRRSIPLAWFVVTLLVVAGGAIAATSAYFALRAPAPSGTLTLTDDLGRSVVVPRDPARVAVLSPSIMDTMFRLGLRSHVVGVDCYSAIAGGLSADYSPDQVSLWGLSPSMCVQVGPTLEPEQLLNLTPQLVLASTLLSVAEVETISQVDHLPVLILQPPTLSGVLVDVAQIGEIFGVTGAATLLEDELKSELANASALGQNLSSSGTPFPTVLVTYSVDSNGYWTFGPGTFGESLIELASASSIAANSTLPYPELSGEQVLAANPAYLVYGTGFGLDEATYAANGPFWSQLSAVHDGHALGINSNYLTEPDPTMILSGLPALIALLHGTPS